MTPSFATRDNLELLEENYARWQEDPASVDGGWGAFFEGFELGRTRQPDGAKAPEPGSVASRVDAVVYAYRTLGHTIAKLDPLTGDRPQQPLLDLAEFGFGEKDLDMLVSPTFFHDGREVRLRDLIAELRRIYCGTIGAEFMHIQNRRVRNWILARIEARGPATDPAPERQVAILSELIEAEQFEHFLHTRYVGQKRFSLEGGETLIAILDTLLEDCPRHGVQEMVMAMAHRGRLNVLTNFLCKKLPVVFAEFSENFIPDLVGGDGDVKYHLGYRTVRRAVTGEQIGIRLTSNPSHLEAVDPVLLGIARARQRILDDTETRSKVLPVLIHGDAAFAGQGIVSEVLNMSQLPGYKIGGTVHIIVNNQIGFTTLPADARSSYYATDVAKMIEAPVFHVNGDDPLAAVFVTQLAFEFRQQFHRDVVIDMYCYRRHGHNEGDEPMFTQPSLYAEIGTHPPVGSLFEKQLVDSGVLTGEQAAGIVKEFQAKLQAAFEEVKSAEKEGGLSRFSESTAEFQPAYSFEPADTRVPRERLEPIVRALTTMPEGFKVQPKIRKLLLDRRAKAFEAGGPIDWAFAETLAFGSLLMEGAPVRLSGQDSRRGTFSQRHSVLYDAKTRERYIPLLNIGPDQARFCVYNSLLSEAAVLGFDYGYSLSYPEMLCIWEAQFGDFANGAQVIIDQFIAAAESKWGRPSGLVMLLPHGYEGQGPEHSSARLERFLQLCAEENIQVCNFTTPAQYFHALRRQVKRPFRKPLIIMTPKSLLRADLCVSNVDELTGGGFREILPGPLPAGPEKIERVIFCSGKVYYDLLQHRDAAERNDTALVRLEQLYPLNGEALVEAVGEFKGAEKFVWCQEESQNMGAWAFIRPRIEELLDVRLNYAGRDPSASTAVGSLAVHRREQRALIKAAFAV